MTENDTVYGVVQLKNGSVWRSYNRYTGNTDDSEPVCPYCGAKQDPTEMYEYMDMDTKSTWECEECGKEFDTTFYTEPHWTSYKKKEETN